LERVSAVNQNVSHALQRARAEMAAVSKESVDLETGAEKGGRAARMLRTVIQQRVQNIDELGGRLTTLSDAAIAVASLLESAGRAARAAASRRSGVVATSSRGDATTFGKASKARCRVERWCVSNRELAGATTEMDEILEKCQLAVEGWQSDVDAAREDLARLKTQIGSWQRYAAIAMTVLLVWVGAGQVSLFGRALEWLSRA
jgi:hypothetical protein